MKSPKKLFVASLFTLLALGQVSGQETSLVEKSLVAQSLENKIEQIDTTAFYNNPREYAKFKTMNLFNHILKDDSYSIEQSNHAFKGIIPLHYYHLSYEYLSENGSDLSEIKLGIHYFNGNSIIFTQHTNDEEPHRISLYDGANLREEINFYNDKEPNSLEIRYLDLFIRAMNKANSKYEGTYLRKNPIGIVDVDEVAFTFVDEVPYDFKDRKEETLTTLEKEGLETTDQAIEHISTITETYAYITEFEYNRLAKDDPYKSFNTFFADGNGDCEDGGIAQATLLEDNGYYPYILYMARNTSDDVAGNESAHAVHIYKNQELLYGTGGINAADFFAPVFNDIDELLRYYTKHFAEEDSDLPGYDYYKIYDLKGLFPNFANTKEDLDFITKSRDKSREVNTTSEIKHVAYPNKTKGVYNLPTGIFIEQVDKYEILIPDENIGKQVNLRNKDQIINYEIQDGILQDPAVDWIKIKSDHEIFFNDTSYQLYIIEKN